jgi:hypothetical protein
VKPATLVALMAMTLSASGDAADAQPTANWTALTWRGEQAFVLTTAQWRAIVSIERGRLVHFGPAAEETNLLFASATRDDPFSWGGHRVWFGPQSLWGWPPPVQWERSAAERATASGASLELFVPDAGDGWPRMTRIYELAEGKLACRVRAEGGTRSAQVMQILQTATTTEVDVQPRPSAAWPRGYVRVGGSLGPALQPEFLQPQVVTVLADGLRLRYTGIVDKLAFPPQALRANIGAHLLRVDFGGSRGVEVATPDAGFYSQVYLGEATSPVVELEQLSPQWKAGEAAEFTMLVDLPAR